MLSWEGLTRKLARVRAAIVLCPHPTAEEVTAIEDVHRRFPLLPLLLVTDAGSLSQRSGIPATSASGLEQRLRIGPVGL